MSKNIDVLIFFLVIIIPSTSFANFGLGPCCPPSICGIIPCDSGCSGSAINQMGTSISNGFNNLGRSHQDLTAGVKDAIKTMTDLGGDINSALIEQNSNIVSGLGASTAKIELTNNVSAKTFERLADHNVKSLVNGLKEIEVSRSITENNLLYGESANPLSGEIGVNQALAVKTINTQYNQLLVSSTNEFISFLYDRDNKFSGSNDARHDIQSLSLLKDNDRLEKMLTSKVLEKEEFQNLQQLVGLSVAKQPLPEDLNKRGEKYNLNRKRHISLLAMAYSGLLRSTMSKAALIDASWADYYQDVNINQDGDTSLTAFYDANINGRLSDQEWWGSILRLNEVGLQREKTYQTAISSQLRDQLGSLSSQSNDLFAIILVKNQEEKSEKLQELYNSL